MKKNDRDRHVPLLTKAIRIMKVTSLCNLLAVCSISASTYAQSLKFSIHKQNSSISEVFKEIEKKSDFTFFFNDNQINVKQKVNVSANNANIEDVLAQVLQNTGYDYQIIDKQILIKVSDKDVMVVPSVAQGNKKIIGIVLDATGMPVIGANVMEKGTTNGTITDMDGKFSLEAREGAVLVVSYIGFANREIKIGSQTNLSIALKEDAEALDELVVVGYGAQKKVNLTGAISSVKFDEELSNRPITNASQALAGKVSGVWISQNSGQPGEDNAQLRVRGWGTMNNSDPLVIIDGVEGVFSQVNPNDIESISVLKDAASAAIYGSKAANGVILVTTKTGKNLEKTQVDLNSYVGVQQLGRRYDLVTNSAELMKMANQAMINNGSKTIFPESLIADFESGTDCYKYPNTDWYNVIYRNALVTEHNLSIRGGTEKLSSFVSLNYLNQEGIMVNTQSERYGIRANVEYKINKNIRLGSRLNYSRQKTEEPFSIFRVYEQFTGATPFIAPYTRDGQYGSVQAIGDDGTLLYTLYQPLIDANNGLTKKTTDYMSLNAYAIVDFTKDLNLQVTWASNGSWIKTDKHNESLYGYTDSGLESIAKNYNRDGIVLSRTQVTSMRNNFQATLNFKKNITDQHHVSSVLGAQLENYSEENVYARRINPPKESMTEVDAGTDGIQANGNFTGLRMASYFGRLNYDYADKYLFEMNLRADASSRFKRGNRWGVFPGFSAGWRLGEEDFIKNLNLFSNLKLRASWGQLGNQTLNGYWPYLTTITQDYSNSYSEGGNLASGAAVTDLVDEDITWETTSSLDIGLDLGVLNNRLNVEFDYFNKMTRDILVQLPISMILGNKTAPYENIGKMKNNGFELVVNYDNAVTSRDRFCYNIGFNFTYINNKVTTFQGGNSPDQLYLIREGYSYKSLYGYKAIGIYQSDEEAANHMHSNGYMPQKGNIKYEDVNNDGKLDYQDKQVLGNTIPKITYGISAGLSYKGFDLNLLFQGLGKGNAYTYNGMTQLLYEWMSIADFWKDAWTPENADSNIPMLRFDNSWDQYESSFWMHRIDFLKLKNLQLGYSFPESVISKLKLSRLYIYANASNLFTIMWHKGYEGYDPERNTFDSGKDVYPTPRIFTFGLNLNF